MIKKIYIFFLSLFAACSTPQQKHREFYTDYRIDTILIPIRENNLPTYNVASSLFQNELYEFNYKLYAFDIFDIDRELPVRSIVLDKQGNHGVPVVSAFTVSDNGIIIDALNTFVLMDHQGNVIKRIYKNALDEQLPDKCTFHSVRDMISNFLTICHNDHYHELVLPINRQDNSYDSHCLAVINLENEKVDILPIPFPRMFHKDNFGNLDYIQPLALGDSVIYNFPSSSDVYLYHRKTKTISKYHIPSNFTIDTSEPLKSNKQNRKALAEHYLTSLFFHGITYDPYHQFFIRLHADVTTTDKIFDRDQYLTFFDRSFQKIGEIKIPSSFYPEYLVTKRGILFQTLQSETEDTAIYYLYNF